MEIIIKACVSLLRGITPGNFTVESVIPNNNHRTLRIKGFKPSLTPTMAG